MHNHHHHGVDHTHGDEAVLRTRDGHRVHAPGSAGALNRRRFMTAMFATTGVAAFATLAACSGADTTGSTTSATRGGPPAGGGPDGMAEGITGEFVGLTTDGTVVPDLYAVQASGVSTSGVVAAATAWLSSLSDDQRTAASFEVAPEDYTQDEWRLWSNVDSYQRNGVSLEEMDDTQKAAAMAILEAGLSAQGLDNAETIMKLNTYGGILVGQESQFNEDLYWFTVMGTPSETEPWGFQVDGHHLVINYFVLGDQVVMTPCFWGSEPTTADKGLDSEYEGLSVFDEEFALAVAAIQSLSSDEQATAILSADKSAAESVAGAFQDNLVQPYEGALLTDLSSTAQEAVLAFVARMVGNVDDGHAAIKMAEIREHLDATYFAWKGDTGDDAVFYTRIQSPVIWIEFDCEGPGPLGKGVTGSSRNHVHADVRTPNGGDYGKSLLALHLALDH
ncbi:DUF3500 domain-containing protein [Kineococcus auxinigenes]|uniref:DUF3500 domain-containing protein n=1 Tax=unclassified Kineococcus TaxID=2621656 RepID=UPI003D7E8FC0